ncbi:hypothetical protein DSL72_001153 [Monilinia vaccinii-corymbosi]|uniref:Uncharacterized protein n=1 Tax=Monilinia vaccinii-corymbosi TaxID=61207 RepID=A0A8A3P6Z4_9HELO|nr:hypothetical protein DSL72_001153 [Monilinia vaccinii-corymbosi]
MSYSLAWDDTPQVLNLYSEWLCFSILWAGIRIHSYISRKEILHVRGSDLDEESTSLAFFIVASSPFLTPALYFVIRNNSVEHHALPGGLRSRRSEYPANYGYHLIFYILIAISTSLLFLPSSTNPVAIGLALVFLICQTAIYSRLSPSLATRDDIQPVHQLFRHLEGTCCWVVCFLTVILLVSRQQAPEIPSLLVYSAFKALIWIALIFLCNEGHACTLTLMSTFGLSTIYTIAIQSPRLAVLCCLCALLILAHIISTLPRNCSTRRTIALFAIFPLAALLFRFGFFEFNEAFSNIVNGLFPDTRCPTNEKIVRNATEIAQAVLDEPSRLIAEFGARDEPQSWLISILRWLKPCADQPPVAVDLR